VLDTDYTVDYLTGIITFDTAPSIGHAITFGCQFDVPVRFGEEVDELLAVSARDFDAGAVPSGIPLVEDMGELDVLEDLYFRGSSTQEFSGDITLGVGMGMYITLIPSTTGLTVFFDSDIIRYPLGGIHHVLSNEGSDSLTLDDGVGTMTLAAGEAALACVVSDNSVLKWKVFKMS
jgi:hypothetical protein